MYELSLLHPHISGTVPEAGWSATASTTAADGMMTVGSHRAFPRHLFALGLGGAGVNGAWLAGRILGRRWTGTGGPGDDLFGMLR
jgi:glycine/D-amino acid oxidase-like deaminating enzyme